MRVCVRLRARKNSGGRQRLTRDKIPELVEATRQLDKVELTTTNSAEKQVRRTLGEGVEPHRHPNGVPYCAPSCAPDDISPP